MSEEPLPPMTHRPRTHEERRTFEKWWDRQVERGWERNGKPPALINARTTPPPSIVGTRPTTPDDQCEPPEGWIPGVNSLI